MTDAELLRRAAAAVGYSWNLGGFEGITMPTALVVKLLDRIDTLAERPAIDCPLCGGDPRGVVDYVSFENDQDPAEVVHWIPCKVCGNRL